MTNLLSLNSYHYRRGGSDAVYFDHDLLFRNIGWHTASFSMHHPKNKPSEWSDYFVDEIEFGKSYSLIKKLQIGLKVVYSWEARSKLRKLLDVFQPDIAHAHCIYHHLSPSVLSLLREVGVPIVLTAHDLKLACPAYKMLNRHGICEKCRNGNLFNVIKNRCIHESVNVSALVAIESSIHRLFGLYKKNVNKIIVPSKFYLEKLQQWGWEREQLVYIPNFIDHDQYDPDYCRGSYYLYFGRLAPEKGVETLIRVCQKSSIPLKIAGTGPSESYLRSLVSKDSKHIEFLGYIAGARLQSTIQQAKAIVVPSQWYENAPISILEAFACGKPVIGADIGGIPELIENGKTGLIFESGSFDELSTQLEYFDSLSSFDVASMGRACREFVETAFSKTRYLENTISLYESLGVRVN